MRRLTDEEARRYVVYIPLNGEVMGYFSLRDEAEQLRLKQEARSGQEKFDCAFMFWAGSLSAASVYAFLPPPSARIGHVGVVALAAMATIELALRWRRYHD